MMKSTITSARVVSTVGILQGGVLCTLAEPVRVDVRISPKDKWQAIGTRTLDTMPDFKQGAPVQLSKYGGRLDKWEKATGFFHVADRDGRWWMVDPDGCLFISAGLNTVSVPDNEVNKNWFKYPTMFIGDNQPSTELFSACRAINTQLYPLADFFGKE